MSYPSASRPPVSFSTLFKFSTLAIFALSATGCSYLGFGDYFRDRSNDYRRSEEMAHISVPEDLDADGVGELYPVPVGGEVVSYEIDSEFVVPRPNSASLNQSANQVKIQRLGDEVWILLSVGPSEAWPKIRSYLTLNGIPSAKADASQGVIETGLFKLSDDEGRFQQFQISLSQGVQLNTTEVEILHRSFSSDVAQASLPIWPEQSDDVDRENWLRDGLAGDLASETAAGTASLLGQAIGAASKVELITPIETQPYIEMRMAFDRAWASVGYALNTDGFEVREGVLDNGYYLSDLQEVGSDEKPKLWRRFLRFNLENANPIQSYRIDLQPRNGVIEVRVINADGSGMSQRENYLLLQRIRSNLA